MCYFLSLAYSFSSFRHSNQLQVSNFYILYVCFYTYRNDFPFNPINFFCLYNAISKWQTNSITCIIICFCCWLTRRKYVEKLDKWSHIWIAWQPIIWYNHYNSDDMLMHKQRQATSLVLKLVWSVFRRAVIWVTLTLRLFISNFQSVICLLWNVKRIDCRYCHSRHSLLMWPMQKEKSHLWSCKTDVCNGQQTTCTNKYYKMYPC